MSQEAFQGSVTSSWLGKKWVENVIHASTVALGEF